MMGTPYGHERAEKKDSTWLIIVIILVVVVVLPIILSAVLYVMVLGFGEDGGPQTPTATYVDEATSGGRMVTILSIQASDPVPWDAVTIQLNTGTAFWNWEPTKAGLTGSPGTSQNCSRQIEGSLTVWCVVVDLGGDGYISGSDYFVLNAEFVDNTLYQACLIYEDSGQVIGMPVTWTA